MIEDWLQFLSMVLVHLWDMCWLNYYVDLDVFVLKVLLFLFFLKKKFLDVRITPELIFYLLLKQINCRIW